MAKYVRQWMSFLMPAFLIWATGNSNNISVEQANIILKWINVFSFAGVLLISTILYFYSMAEEFGSQQKKCYTKFQWSLLFIGAISLSFAVTTYNWVESIGPAYTMSKIDVVFAVTDTALIIFFIYTEDMLTNIFFGRSFFPFAKKISARKKALEILVDEGTISKEKRDEVLETQKKGEEE
jgi:hypothetical protein